MTDIPIQWAAVRNLQESRLVNTNTAWLGIGGFPSHMLANLCESLILVHAYAVLSDALEEKRDAGLFSFKGRNLEPMMKASRQALHWQDFDAVDKGRELRNEVAHHGKFFTVDECQKYVDLIEVELRAWGYQI